MGERLLKKINGYFENGWYIFTVAAVCTVCWCAGKAASYDSRALALAFCYVGFTLVALLGCAVLLSRRDLTPLLANILLIAFSNSVYGLGGKGFFVLVCVLIPLVLISVGLHVWLWYFKYKPEEKFRFTFGKLRWSWLAVIVTAAVSGIGCALYDFKYLPGLLAMCAAFYALYLFVLNVTTADRTYVMRVLFAVGMSVSIQLFFYYIVDGGNFFDKLVDRQYTLLGWSKYVNSVCNVLFFCIPAAFYLAIKSKYSPLYVSGAALMAINGAFMVSRGNLLVGAIVLLPIGIYTLVRAEYRGRTVVTAFLAVSLVAVLFCVFYEQLQEVFRRIWKFGNGSGRIPIWEDAVKWFKKYPVFGLGYFGEHPDILATHFSGSVYKVHNSLLQVLMCSGIVGFVAIVFHYAQKIWLFKNPDLFKLFTCASLLIIEGYGLMDLTMTTGYIVLFVYVLLAATEKERDPERLRIPHRESKPSFSR